MCSGFTRACDGPPLFTKRKTMTTKNAKGKIVIRNLIEDAWQLYHFITHIERG
jgi:hypothetical protein